MLNEYNVTFTVRDRKFIVNGVPAKTPSEALLKAATQNKILLQAISFSEISRRPYKPNMRC